MFETKSHNRKGFDMQQIAFAVQNISLIVMLVVSEVLKTIRLQEEHSAALMIFQHHAETYSNTSCTQSQTKIIVFSTNGQNVANLKFCKFSLSKIKILTSTMLPAMQGHVILLSFILKMGCMKAQ